MLIAKPAPEAKIREVAAKLAESHPGISVESFLLPRDESCNYQWNTVSTRTIALILEWYLSEGKHHGEDNENAALSELLAGIVGSAQHSVVIDHDWVPVSVDYLRKSDSWISNYTAVAILGALSRHLGQSFAEPSAGLSASNPWLPVISWGLGRSDEALGLLQKLATLKNGPRAVYLDLPATSAHFHRAAIFELISDSPIGSQRRRVNYVRHMANYFFVPPEEVGLEAAIFAAVPLVFSQQPLLHAIPGFELAPAKVQMTFPDGDICGTWEITVDYDITPIDRVRSWFHVGELQETVATLSAEVLELQRDRKALSEEAEQLAGQLIEAEKLAAVGRLSFGVGHDLRNTLATAINSGIPLRRLMADLQQVMGMLEEEKPPEEIAEYMSRRRIHLRLGNAPDLYETMMNSLAQALENVKALEGYAVQDGSDFQEMRIEEVIERVLGDHRDELDGIQVETCFEAREYTFQGNPLKIYDIVQNLVLNAIEAMEGTEVPVLRITTGVHEGMHRTIVEDNGCGMSEEVMRNAFEPFYTTRDLADGRQRGLGLFNVWRLVEQHSGKIEIESEPGQGSSLRVSFNLAP